MELEQLENLVKIKRLKHEPPDRNEFEGLVSSAKRRLQDAQVAGLSEESRFSLAYGASHALALSALRWHGYRSEHRYLVFQCLEQTLGLARAKWRVLDQCHQQRNLAEYEGHLEITAQLLQALIDVSKELLTLVEALGPIKQV